MARKEKKKLILDNGMQVWIDRKQIGKCAAHLELQSGSAMDIKPETAHLLEHLQGINARVYGESGELEYCSHSKNASTTFDRTAYYIYNFLPEHLNLVTSNLRNALAMTPRKKYFDREKNSVRNELKRNVNPFQFLVERVNSILLPNYRRWCPGINERLESLETIDVRTCFDFWKDHYNPGNSILYLGGELPASLKQLIVKFDKLSNNRGWNKPKEEWPDETPLENRVEIIESIRQDPTASIEISYQLPTFMKKKRFKEDLASTVLQQYLNSTDGPLYKELRDKSGLCYSAGVGYDRFGDIYKFAFSAQTSPDRYKQVEEKFLNIISKISKEGIPNKFLETNRNWFKVYLINTRYNFDMTIVARQFRHNRMLEDDINTINQLKPEDIAAFAGEIARRNYVISIALPEGYKGK